MLSRQSPLRWRPNSCLYIILIVMQGWFHVKTRKTNISNFFILKNGLFSKVHDEKLFLLFSLFLWDLTNLIYIKDTLSFMIFMFFYCVKIFGTFMIVFGTFTYFNIATKPFIKTLATLKIKISLVNLTFS